MTQERAEVLMAFATEQGFAFWVVQGTIMRGWALAMQGQGEAGIAQMRQGLTAWHASGQELERPYFSHSIGFSGKRRGGGCWEQLNP